MDEKDLEKFLQESLSSFRTALALAVGLSILLVGGILLVAYLLGSAGILIGYVLAGVIGFAGSVLSALGILVGGFIGFFLLLLGLVIGGGLLAVAMSAIAYVAFYLVKLIFPAVVMALAFAAVGYGLPKIMSASSLDALQSWGLMAHFDPAFGLWMPLAVAGFLVGLLITVTGLVISRSGPSKAGHSTQEDSAA